MSCNNFFPKGKMHKIHRKYLSPAFSSQNIQLLIPNFNEIAKKHVSRYHKYTETGEFFDVFPAIQDWTFDLIFKNQLCLDLDEMGDVCKQLSDCFKM